MANEYDLVILGGGTGGYVAAIRASQLGLKTAIVEKSKLGGTCLHNGCIPSKALLRSAEVYATAKKAEDFGVLTSDVSLDFGKVQARKAGIVQKLHSGVQYLMKKGKIDVYEGNGRILGPSIFSPIPGTISVEMNNGEENEMLLPKNVIVSTGSRPNTLPGLDVDGKYVLSSEEALKMEELPKSILIVGGGVIGVEWASMLADFDVDVTVIEYSNTIVPTEDKEISLELKKQLEKKGVKVVTGAKVLSETLEKKEQVSIQAEIKGEKVFFAAEKLLVSVGRIGNVEGIGLENTDIIVNNNKIEVNDHFQTKESHIYAIGDVIGGLQLAHVASHEGLKAVEHIAGLSPERLDYQKIAKCIYTHPEVASIGYSEEEAIAKGFDIKKGKFSFQAIGKALVHGEQEGFVKIIADRKTDDILGVHIIGPHATDMISEAALAMVLDAAPWEIGATIHPHPTLSEAIGEAALAVDGKEIHG
ncbi:dihydrolipoyl dehydrogenase [Niallia taxi]|uniref:dihydrolipoyl dehydrogenase n=1 Tax=Niallia taxi TaxID=2499688 RepID=UPI0015F4993E|nr:dihydrolipoyl dehydrogenase [Niallia taxi]MED4040638.1 dihydrolipoyl dehydrogenase [Niallia taxi]